MTAKRPPLPPDTESRRRIVEDLDTNVLVEAGAGSGKTTALLDRMVALVGTGASSASEMVAVTFTRKAAGELRQRFQERLEGALAEAAPDGEERCRLARALDEIDQTFIGTIHAFCARLLRERPLEAGIDPGFQELTEEAFRSLTAKFWSSYVERLTTRDDPGLAMLLGVGMGPDQVRGLFEIVNDQPDVDFPTEGAERPSAESIAAVRSRLEELMDDAEALVPSEEPEKGWDSLQKRVRSLAYSRQVGDWASDARFFEALATVCRSSRYKVVQIRWGDAPAQKARAKNLGEAFTAFVAEDAPARLLLDAWRTHRYPIALDMARRAADTWREERKRAGHLSFQDLLMEAAALLRTSPGARRQLGSRYTRILVDEFQDTDPVQAEVLLLLASDPCDEGGQERSWSRVTPRPGALFVVGDPKQSIYRFRRADIAVYNLVKERFRDFGDVLGLEANFRSRETIGQLVNQVFSDEARFPGEATDHQAAFAPLLTQAQATAPVREGVFYYDVPEGGSPGEIVRMDAEALGSWLARRCGPEGDRKPADFLILTRHRSELSTYAAALEARGVPVAVTGAQVGFEREARELITLLEALVDPGDLVRSLSVLVGPFFGLDHQVLYEHREAGGSFSFTRVSGQPDTPVTRALQKLNRWWEAARREPADVVAGRVFEDLVLLPRAASRSEGQLGAGSLVFALDTMRSAALDGDTSLRGALETLVQGFASAETEAPLEPLRPDTVRLMNLHKAKGLEAPVVVLAASRTMAPRAPTSHVERGEDGLARGYALIEEAIGWGRQTHAQPPEWDRRSGEERRFLEAEDVRLMYVAATRAADELVVARRREHPDKSPWRMFDAWLEAHGQPLGELVVDPPRAAPPLERSGNQLLTEVRGVERERKRRSGIGYDFVSVTSLAKGGASGEQQLTLELPAQGAVPSEPSRGLAWGTVVHGALAVAALGTDADALRVACRSLLVENERPLDLDGEPTELDELVALIAGVRASTLWQRAAKADLVLAETPFSVAVTDLNVPGVEPTTEGSVSGRTRYVEGVIDLAFREAEAWVVADYKTDLGTDPAFPARALEYKRQVDLYAECWERLTGTAVKERILLYTSQHRQEVW